jgi:hypothetical protein
MDIQSEVATTPPAIKNIFVFEFFLFQINFFMILNYFNKLLLKINLKNKTILF